ncbi:MAG: hypothetical protein JXA42_21145 [Anaerolineales bacterium]|nr:hypothetical protein [Anaerolineales bacterium]
MNSNEIYRQLFVCIAFLVQGLLILNFAARNWRPSLERRFGWIIYALGLIGVVLGVVFLAGRAPWYMILAPLVLAVWAGYGYAIDILFKIEWRAPIRLAIFIPYVLLFMASQFVFWIPMWYIGIGYWVAYTITYTINTILNIISHKK